jgi:opacity protein-like surface antigen
MSIRKWTTILSGFALAAFMAPATASADWIVTPFIGWNFHGSADVNGTTTGTSTRNQFEHKLDYGASVDWMGKGIVGAELDLGYSPNFFETSSTTSGNIRFTNGSNVVTLTGNVIVGAPIGGHGGSIRPYAVAGVGLIRTNVQDFAQTFDVNTKNDFGFDAGAGVMGYFSQHVGLRGDIRYFRGFNGSNNTTGLGLSSFNFWRGSVGVSFKF